MKNDIRKADEITVEMRVNDIVYGIISDELDNMICDCEDLLEEFEKLYFAKRVPLFLRTAICRYARLSDCSTMFSS